MPSDYDSLLHKGIALNKLGRPGEAITHFNKALKIRPTCDRALINKGISYDYLGQYGKARKFYDKALKLNPNNALAMYNKSCSLAWEDNLRESLYHLKKAIDIDPRYKALAIVDDDRIFEKYKNNKQFKRLIAS